jgi:hypothetical protein
MCFFILLTVAFVPLMHKYAEWNDDNDMGFIAQYTIGNMGQAATNCGMVHMAMHDIYLQCTSGIISGINDFGLNEFDSAAELENRCHTDWTDPEQQPECLKLS